ncbi:HlyD family secretion protein [Vibrio sp. 10N]|uniref:HlyD family secretion protein n=1 Tax=Vibrio sp. 10N TaxID=3058938 RepID=UPI0028133C9C|nr:HlyD family efflux transporter periplasmic adaptor subunit [Vibrio sp. 10N]
MSLFRQEVLEAKKTNNMGVVVIHQPISIYWISAIIITISLIAGWVVANTEYARRETVVGYLVPNRGLAKVYSGRSGVVEGIKVAEGQEVQKGDILATIRNSESLATGVELSQQLTLHTRGEIDALKAKKTALLNLKESSEKHLKSKVEQLEQAKLAVINTSKSAKRKRELAKQRFLNAKTLYSKGYMSSVQFDDFQEQYLDSQTIFDQTEQLKSELDIEMSDIRSELASLPHNHQMEINTLTQEILSHKSQLARLENQFAFVVKAPESGIATAIRVNEGSRVSSSSPLLSIIPKDSPLILEMLLPSHSAGFAQVGDEVNIRLDAFPYQKFGFLSGQVIHVDKALLLPEDEQLPVEIPTAMYRIKASLSSQHIQAVGTLLPLKVGMLAEADIILESRTIAEWLLEPLLSIKGKL